MKRSAFVAALSTAALLSSAAGAMSAVTTASAATASPTPRHSSSFAGYEVSKLNAHIRHVTATFVVPTITCENNFGGVGPSVLVYSNLNPRTGAHRTSGGGIGVACDNGSPLYQSVFVVNDKTLAGGEISFSPGDVVVVTVSATRAASRVTISDETTSTSRTHSGAGKVASETFIGDSSVNVDGVSGKLDPFTRTHVSNVLVDNRPLGESHPTRFWWVRHRTTLVTASALQAEQNFTLTFRNSG